jgi:hypothetical protein
VALLMVNNPHDALFKGVYGQAEHARGVLRAIVPPALAASRAFQELLLRLLRHRFGDAVDTRVEQRVASASVHDIETWSLRVSSAATIAEVFAD